LPIPYAPPNMPMRTPGEIRLVKGLDDAETLMKLFPGATPETVPDLDLGNNHYLTPFGAELVQTGTQAGTQTAKVNVNTAAPEVLTALILGVQAGVPTARGSAEGIVEELVAQRQEKQLTKLDEVVSDKSLQTALGKVADVKSTHFRIESVG